MGGRQLKVSDIKPGEVYLIRVTNPATQVLTCRPVMIIACLSKQTFFVCSITAQGYGYLRERPFAESDIIDGRRLFGKYLQPEKLMTVNFQDFLSYVGCLGGRPRRFIQNALWHYRRQLMA